MAGTTMLAAAAARVARRLPAHAAALSTGSNGGGSTSSAPDPAAMPHGPARWYMERVASGALAMDPHQVQAARLLQDVFEELVGAHRSGAGSSSSSYGMRSVSSEQPIGMMGSLFGRRSGPSALSSVPSMSSSAADVMPGTGARGVYLWGGVGCGKTMLMDAFYDLLPASLHHRRRVHFHAFMLEVHARLFQHRSEKRDGDAILGVASSIAREAALLCFDEMQVTDVGDAMLMHRLFGRLFDRGVTVVTTSNRPPDDLYKNGLQRELFLPFIERIKSKCTVHRLGSAVDYRMVGEQQGNVWFAGNEASTHLEHMWHRVTQDANEWECGPVDLETHGRRVRVPRASREHGACWFSFEELCRQPKSAADFLVIANAFPFVFLDGVPIMTLSERDEVRRLIILVDTLYDQRCKLFVAAASPLRGVFEPRWRDGPLLATDPEPDEIFAFDRCASRLTDMGTRAYLSAPWAGHHATL